MSELVDLGVFAETENMLKAKIIARETAALRLIFSLLQLSGPGIITSWRTTKI
jgi:hypothetical protein